MRVFVRSLLLSLSLAGVLVLGGCAIERRRRFQIGAHLDRQRVGHPAAIAEAGGADPAAAVGPRLQPARRGQEILAPLGIVELGEHLSALVIVARISAQRRQRVRREGHEILQGKSPGNVLGVGVQAAILVDDDDARQLRRLLVT